MKDQIIIWNTIISNYVLHRRVMRTSLQMRSRDGRSTPPPAGCCSSPVPPPPHRRTGPSGCAPPAAVPPRVARLCTSGVDSVAAPGASSASSNVCSDVSFTAHTGLITDSSLPLALWSIKAVAVWHLSLQARQVSSLRRSSSSSPYGCHSQENRRESSTVPCPGRL